jgi:glutamate-5-semialdehyde dehydrogenase
MSALRDEILSMGKAARRAALELALIPTAAKNQALLLAADALEQDTTTLIAANRRDLEAGEARGLSGAMLDRLRLDSKRLAGMAGGLREVAGLPDPVGEILEERTRPNGLNIRKIRTPIGVIGIIYESRPNVTCDATGLCLKTGNAVILRGGSEAIHSNLAIANLLQDAAGRAGLPRHCVQLVSSTDREAVTHLARMDAYLDVLIPRGGHALIERVVAEARMPVIKHYHGVCHVYVDKAADLEMAGKIAVNAKCQRPGVCNAMETLVVHAEVAGDFLPGVAEAFRSAGVEIRGDSRSLPLLGALAVPATEEDWTTEYLDLIVSVKVVDSLEQAVDFINTYGSHHSDAIVTKDESSARAFLAGVDSAAVYWNASTRFTDGGEFGFGAEIGISTDKLHARGPMALPELTSYKYVIVGNGQVRE